MILNHGTNQARGVAIIINGINNVKIIDQQTDLEGRIILLEVEIEGKPYALLNTYFPNSDKPQKQQEFIENIMNMVADKAHKLVWGGDINIQLDPKLDSYANNQKKSRTKPAQTLSNTLEELE